jgi:hypothetical protein
MGQKSGPGKGPAAQKHHKAALRAASRGTPLRLVAKNEELL